MHFYFIAPACDNRVILASTRVTFRIHQLRRRRLILRYFRRSSGVCRPARRFKMIFLGARRRVVIEAASVSATTQLLVGNIRRRARRIWHGECGLIGRREHINVMAPNIDADACDNSVPARVCRKLSPRFRAGDGDDSKDLPPAR